MDVLEKKAESASNDKWKMLKSIFGDFSMVRFLVFQIILATVDVLTDLRTAFILHNLGHDMWATSILTFVFMPFIISVVIELPTLLLDLKKAMTSLCKCTKYLPLVQVFVHVKYLLDLRKAKEEIKQQLAFYKGLHLDFQTLEERRQMTEKVTKAG